MTETTNAPAEAGANGSAGTSQGTAFSEAQVEILARRAIDVETARAAGVTPVQTEAELPDGAPDYWTTDNGYLPGLLFRYVSPSGHVELQLRPDVPVVNGKGKTAKYVFAKGALSVLHEARPVSDDGHDWLILLTEGTCQTIAAARWAPDKVTISGEVYRVAVYGIAGCQSWMKDGVPTPDLSVVDGHLVSVVLDADAGTNRAVYEAGDKLQRLCAMSGGRNVRFTWPVSGGKAGTDDVLGPMARDKRQAFLGRVIVESQERAGRNADRPAPSKPAARKADKDSEGGGSPWFDADGALLVETLAQAVVNASGGVALTADNRLAAYQNGVYVSGNMGVLAIATELLGEAFRINHVNNLEAYLTGQCVVQGWRLPERTSVPLVNVRNGMLDLRTGKLLKHSPKYLSTLQLPVEWHPDATCPTYDAWAAECVGADQLADLEESVSFMLDPTVTPTKAVFLFGPSRSGKSTFLDLLKHMAGAENTSGVSLHQLAENRFMAARVFGKLLNVAADLSAAHVDDLSIFKLMTGQDVIEADPKYGKPFTFTNRALFAFSANTLPTVGESSRAYSERIKPFLFGRSFAGHEDPTMRDRLAAELPGILVRWVTAYQRRRARGHDLPPVAAVREHFELESDRVRKWFAERMEVISVEGSMVEGGTAKRDLGRLFKGWAAEGNGPDMSQGRVVARLLNIPGVREVRDAQSKVRVLNVRQRPENDWGVAVVAIPNHYEGDVDEQITPAEAVTHSSDGGLKSLKTATTATPCGDSAHPFCRCP